MRPKANATASIRTWNEVPKPSGPRLRSWVERTVSQRISNAATAAHEPAPAAIGPRLKPLSPKTAMRPAARSGSTTGASNAMDGIEHRASAVDSGAKLRGSVLQLLDDLGWRVGSEVRVGELGFGFRDLLFE